LIVCCHFEVAYFAIGTVLDLGIPPTVDFPEIVVELMQT